MLSNTANTGHDFKFEFSSFSETDVRIESTAEPSLSSVHNLVDFMNQKKKEGK